MTLLAYDWNSVLAGMCAVLIVVCVALAVMLDRAKRSTAAMEFLMAENAALRAECTKHGVGMVVAYPLSEVRPVSVPSMWSSERAPADEGTLTVGAVEDWWANAPEPKPGQSYVDFMAEQAWQDGGVMFGDGPVTGKEGGE